MKLDMAGRTPGEVLGVQHDMLERLSGNDGALWLERYKRLHRGENPFAELTDESPVPADDAWKTEIVAYAKRKLKNFSRAWSEQVTAIPDNWTPEFLANAAKFGYKPVFIPDADINETFWHPKYIKPENWFYNNIRNGNIKTENPTRLRKGWYLADSSRGVDYTDGSQILPDDPWASLITKLRVELQVVGRNEKTPDGSRFAITWDEWNDCVLAQWASMLSVTRAQTNLPTTIEWNFIGNIYFPHYGAFNMWVWFADHFVDSRRLVGGRRDDGGLAIVGYYWSSGRGVDVAARPLVSFVS